MARQRLNRLIFILNWLLFCSLVQAETSSAGRGVAFGLQEFINQQTQAGQKTIVVPPGSYRVTPRGGQHLTLRNLQNIQIVADGVEMICTETTTALNISHCTNVTVRGLVIDYDPLPFTQGRITSFSADKKSAEVELFDGYPGTGSAINFKYEIFRPDTRTLRCSDRYVRNLEVMDSRHLRINTPDEHSDSPEQVGDLIVIGSEHAPHGNAAHAVVCDHNVNVRLENIDLFASNCFGFIEDNCDSSTYYRCRIDRRSAADDLVKRAEPRLRSLNADAYHSSDAVKGPAYIECVAKFMGDDCVNIHGRYELVVASTGAVLRVVSPERSSFAAGDPVEFLPFAGERPPDAVVKKVEPDTPVTSVEKAFIQKLAIVPGVKESLVNGGARCYQVTLDRPTTLPPGSLIAAANHLGDGFLVKGCDFGYNRSRGILIKASHGQLIDNTITESWMAAVLVSPEFFWFEAGSSADVRISGNKVIGCRQPAIEVVAFGGNGKPLASGAHRDITIVSNTISESVLPNIRVTSTSRLVVRDNQLTPVKSGNANQLISIEDCSQPELQSLP
jgi:hypothetical protein